MMKSVFIASGLFIMTVVTPAVASTGDLKGACWRVAQKKFPGADLVGMFGGSMSGFNVSGYLIDNSNRPHKFYCTFPYSHGEPTSFHSDLFASEENDPVDFTRKLVEQINNHNKASAASSDRRNEELNKELESTDVRF